MSQVKFNAEILQAKTVKDIFDVCNKYYETEKAVVGAITKAGLLVQLPKIIVSTGAKLRK